MKSKGKENNEEKMKEKYIQLQIMKQHLTTMIEQRSKLVEKLTEIKISMLTIEKLDEKDENKEMWAPAGSGAYISSTLKDAKNVLIDIGANVYVREHKEKAVEMLKSRYEEIDKIDDDVIVQIKEYSFQTEKLEEELRKMAQE